ncbi:hypothetical protein CY34DRAFT_801129 [Suillus luteus UH-Slu-Lm8-n1]|uniref:Uncharacterized protein n=1 Tax=Suillus luteus UH-Slu-Lm8-n1 TaxID=930992 RepID=A0A0D0BS14_9AGAM|nr:hypothetical protein CY34DRAFT_801129 [Suillus luteus UH-Slu-Lm8-n1]
MSRTIPHGSICILRCRNHSSLSQTKIGLKFEQTSRRQSRSSGQDISKHYDW